MVNLKLYIWTEFCPDYTDGLAFAIAENELEARQFIIKSCESEGFNVWNWGKLEVKEISKCSRWILGGG